MKTQTAINNNMPRLRFFDDDVIWDNAQHYELPKGDTQEIIHPAECAIFVVHGMGEQKWAETAANLRAGLEDVMANIDPPLKYAAPFIYEGFWANYDDLAATFPQNWEKLNIEGEQVFFKRLWETRPFSSKNTAKWFLHQHCKLIKQCEVFKKLGKFHVWWIYLFLFPITFLAFLIAYNSRSQFLNRYLCDVRLYCEPTGAIENAIVQRIDRRIAEQFLKLIGLNTNFIKLPQDEMLKIAGVPIRFKRVVWVAHSLGTIVSYNVLSDLFLLADKLEKEGDERQKAGVAHFHKTVKCFITMSCPLDKIAYLPAKDSIIRTWSKKNLQTLLSIDTEGWVNLYDLCDPISGALSNPNIYYETPPSNLNIQSGWFPFSTHNSYWRNKNTLKLIIEKTYGKQIANISYDAKVLSESQSQWYAILLYVLWLLILIITLIPLLIIIPFLSSLL